MVVDPMVDELRAVVAAGDGRGVVARFRGLLAVAEGPEPAVAALVTLCRECAGPEPGRVLARRLTDWLGSADGGADGLRLGTLAATDRGLAVFLRGAVDLVTPDGGTAIAGADATPWTDRIIDAPGTPVALALQTTAEPVDADRGDPDLLDPDFLDPDFLNTVYDLWEGVVPGVAVVALATGVVPARVDAAAEVAPPRHRRPDTGEQPLVPRDDPAAVRPEPAPGPPSAEPVRGDTPEEPSTDRLPEEPAREELPAPPPRGERPAAGVLLFDDGTALPVEGSCLLGREPDGDARVRAGALRAITLDDSSGAMSRVHAELRVEDRAVVLADSGSSNGTYVAEPGATAWTPLPRGRRLRLVPGTRVQIGQRTFTFETAGAGR